jgi:nicotinamide-nucleotide amidase
MNELNRRQAEVPDCCTVIANDDGTAPGMWFEKNGIIAVSMPGVPSEMKLMFPKVLQRLKQRFTLPVISHRTLMTYGIPESELALQIAGWEQSLPSGMSLAYLPEVGTGIKLRLSCSGRDAEVNALIESRFDQLKALLGDAVYGYEPDTLESVVGKLLTAKNATAATAESCTGGLIAKRITSVAGSSQYFKGGVVAYTNEIKTGLIGVDAAVIERFNAVSTEVAELMAAGARRALNVDYAVATTGIAGPSGALPDKPVGLCCFGIASPRGTKSFQKIFTSDRTGNIASAAAAALNALRLELL